MSACIYGIKAEVEAQPICHYCKQPMKPTGRNTDMGSEIWIEYTCCLDAWCLAFKKKAVNK